MNDQELNEIAGTLEKSVFNEDANSHLHQIAKPDQLFLYGNRAALIRFATQFLRAATAKPEQPLSESDSFDIEYRTGFVENINQYQEEDSDFTIGMIRRSETVPVSANEVKSDRRDFFCFVGCALFGFSILFLLISGIAFWVRLFSG